MVKPKDSDVVLQFFEEYDHEVNVFGTVNGLRVLTDSIVFTGKLKTGKNITILDKQTFERVKENSKAVRGWLASGRMVILDSVPDSYYDAVERVADANLKVNEAKKETDKALSEVERLKKELADAKKKLTEYGAK
jgi:hypothetical protein